MSLDDASPTQPEPIWNPDDHLDRVYRRGRRLRRQRLAGAGGAAVVVIVAVLVLALGGNLTSSNGRRVLTAGQPVSTTTTSAPTTGAGAAETIGPGPPGPSAPEPSTTGVPAVNGGPTTSVTTTAKPATTTTHPISTTTSTTLPITGTVTLSEADNGATKTIRRGATVMVVLHSTYWAFPAPPDPAVLQQVGQAVVVPAPLNACVPGQGCGTVTATYRSVGGGQTPIIASRTTCGEVLLCTGNQGMFKVQVVVSP